MMALCHATRQITLDRVRFFILDEADRCVGHAHPSPTILNMVVSLCMSHPRVGGGDGARLGGRKGEDVLADARSTQTSLLKRPVCLSFPNDLLVLHRFCEGSDSLGEILNIFNQLPKGGSGDNRLQVNTDSNLLVSTYA